MEFDKNSDLKLDDAELKEVSETIFTSLAEYNYFQLVTVDGKDVKMKPPAALMANLDNNQLIVLFESTPETPIPLSGKIDLGIYDPTFYTAIDFTEDENMAVEGLPSILHPHRHSPRSGHGDCPEPADPDRCVLQRPDRHRHEQDFCNEARTELVRHKAAL